LVDMKKPIYILASTWPAPVQHSKGSNEAYSSN